MDKIPEEVMAQAKDLARCSAQAREDGKWLHEAALPIANAILAERRRCAEVARGKYQGHGRTFKTERAMNYEHAGRTIAAAIEANA